METEELVELVKYITLSGYPTERVALIIRRMASEVDFYDLQLQFLEFVAINTHSYRSCESETKFLSKIKFDGEAGAVSFIDVIEEPVGKVREELLRLSNLDKQSRGIKIWEANDIMDNPRIILFVEECLMRKLSLQSVIHRIGAVLQV